MRFVENGIENQMEHIKHFLETMPRLEKLTIYSIDDNVNEVSSQLKSLPRVASPNCEIQVIFDNLS